MRLLIVTPSFTSAWKIFRLSIPGVKFGVTTISFYCIYYIRLLYICAQLSLYIYIYMCTVIADIFLIGKFISSIFYDVIKLHLHTAINRADFVSW